MHTIGFPVLHPFLPSGGIAAINSDDDEEEDEEEREESEDEENDEFRLREHFHRRLHRLHGK